MGKFMKKGIAVLEAVAMSIALVAGVGFESAKVVQAAEASAYSENESYYFRAEQEMIGCNLGDSVTLNIVAYNSKEEKVNIDWDEYTVRWYKLINSGYHEDETIRTGGFSYTIDSVTTEDWYNPNKNPSYGYMAIIYGKDGEFETTVNFYIVNKEEYIWLLGHSYVLLEGDSVTFTPEAYDFDGNEIDISGNEYSFKWYKIEQNIDEWTGVANLEETDLGITDRSYTIDKVSKSDFCSWGGDFPYYEVKMYKDGELKAHTQFYLLNKSTYMLFCGDEYTASEGDSITLTLKAYDYDDNEIDLSDDEYSFKWYKVTWGEDGDRVETDLEASGLNYTISKVTESDFCDPDECNVAYEVDVYKNGVWVDNAYFSIYKDEGSKPIQPPTSSEQPTTGVQPTTSVQTPTGEQPTTAPTKVKAPAQAKITKVASKKKSAKKVKLSLKKITGAKGYQVAFYATNKNAKNNKKAIIKKFVKKTSVTVTSSKLKNKKTLYVKARAYKLDIKKKVYGKWSSIKKVKIK